MYKRTIVVRRCENNGHPASAIAGFLSMLLVPAVTLSRLDMPIALDNGASNNKKEFS